MWSGHNRDSSELTYFDFQVIEGAEGARYLTTYQGSQHDAHGVGHGIIFDNNYKKVTEVYPGLKTAAADSHEFHVIDEGRTALISIYQPVQGDLTDFGVGEGIGWINECIFEEVDVQTGESRFQWRSLDHVAIDEGVLPIQKEKGFGLSFENSFDYL